MSELKVRTMENDRWPAELTEVFQAYRHSAVEPEPGRDFMPGVWTRIEQRQKLTYSFRRLAGGFVTAAAALCLVMSVALWSPSQQVLTAETYVEVLADDVVNTGDLE